MASTGRTSSSATIRVCSFNALFPFGPSDRRAIRRAPACVASPAADEVDDLEHVAVAEQDVGQGRARCDLAVALDRDLERIELERLDERGDRRAGENAARRLDKSARWSGLGKIVLRKKAGNFRRRGSFNGSLPAKKVVSRSPILPMNEWDG